MSGKRPAKLSSKLSGESPAGQNEPVDASRVSEPHSAPATPQQPSSQDASTTIATRTTWGASGATRASKSTPALSATQKRPSAALNAKVAIPRQPPNSAAPRYNRRVPRACESCRQRKTKCSGDTPVCRQCRELRVNCHYPVGWREKMKKWANFETNSVDSSHSSRKRLSFTSNQRKKPPKAFPLTQL